MEQEEKVVAPGTLKSFEMRVVFSVILNASIVGTTKDEKKELIDYLIGEATDRDRVLDYCQYVGPRLINRIHDAERLIPLLESDALDKARYRKICDMHWSKIALAYASVEKPYIE